jgi:hypothetical protein
MAQTLEKLFPISISTSSLAAPSLGPQADSIASFPLNHQKNQNSRFGHRPFGSSLRAYPAITAYRSIKICLPNHLPKDHRSGTFWET